MRDDRIEMPEYLIWTCLAPYLVVKIARADSYDTKVSRYDYPGMI